MGPADCNHSEKYCSGQCMSVTPRYFHWPSSADELLAETCVSIEPCRVLSCGCFLLKRCFKSTRSTRCSEVTNHRVRAGGIFTFSRNERSGVQGMCRQTVGSVESVEIEEELLEFKLIERLTFLEYLPVKAGVRKSSSSPELTALEFDPRSTSTGPAQKETWGRQASVSTDRSSGATWNRQVSATTVCSSSAAWSRQESADIRCLTFHDTLVNAASTKSDNSDPIATDFADLAIPETGSSGSELGAGQWSVGSALHSQGDCKPCA